MDEFFDSADPASIDRFNAMLSEFYLKNRRPMPWRDEITPYRVVVSEIMLQQTQVPRVLKKFDEFIGYSLILRLLHRHHLRMSYGHGRVLVIIGGQNTSFRLRRR